jgi:hypothetical protein
MVKLVLFYIYFGTGDVKTSHPIGTI